MKARTIILGAGGQAKVVYDILRSDETVEIIGFIARKFQPDETIDGVPILGEMDLIQEIIKKQNITHFVIGIGDIKKRELVFKECQDLGLKPFNAIDKSANIADDVEFGEGIVICRGAIVCTKAVIKNNVLINSGAIVEHDDVIHENSHIGPGAYLAGKVIVKQNTFVGLGSRVKENTTIGKNVIIGMGSIVLEDVPDGVLAAGIPAKVKKELREN